MPKNAQSEPDQRYQRIQVAAAQPKHHPKGAAQEHQGADHDESAQQEPGSRRGAALGAEFALDKRHDQRAQHQADDLRPHILDHGGGMEPQGARNIPLEAGDAEAHVGRVA